ncbi:prolipoprotein diacylglyceryl transferase [Patescibacteria group bacterium]
MPGTSALQLGSLEFSYYGIMIALGILVAYLIALYRAQFFPKINMRQIETAFLIALPLAFIGARLYYVIFEWSYYSAHLGKIFAIWEGGLAIHGGLIGGLAGLAIYTAVKKIKLARVLDFAVPSIVLAQAIGRWGNFFNQEAFGGPSDLPWAIPIELQNRPAEFISAATFHPTFLYESIWNLLVFALLFWLAFRARDRKWRVGVIAAVYLIAYSTGRFFIEGLRTDSLYLGSLRVAQLVSLLLIIGGVIFLYWPQIKNKLKNKKNI